MSSREIKNSKKRKKKEVIEPSDLIGFKPLKKFISLLHPLHSVKQHHNRDLHFDQYAALLLLYFFNPVLSSLRGIQQVSHFDKVKKNLGIKGASLGSLSEASNVFDADLLAPIIKDLAKKTLPVEKDASLKKLQQTLVATDGTLLPALPKMLWALWLDDQHKAAKLHLEFDVLKHAPINYKVTDANTNEKSVFRDFLSANKLYVTDAGYSEYKLLQEIIDAKSSFVNRIRDNAVWDLIEERPITSDDKKAGVQRDLVVQLGSQSTQGDIKTPLRIIEVFHQGDSSRPRKSRVSSKKSFRTTESDYTFLLATDRMDLSAEMIALIYRYRWQIELFFRWFKCILGCKHLLAHSENGVTIQVYCALIASMLITLWTGAKPNKRTFEMLTMYFMGWATDNDLERHLEKLNPAE